LKWDQIEGWFSHADADFVRQICANIHDGVVVELGFFAGRCTAVMAPICQANGNKYHAVDNCAGADIRDPATKAQKSRDMRKAFDNNMKSLNLLDYVSTHVADSAASSRMFTDECVDFCFVDASHVAENVKRDIEAWWPKIKRGGVLGGHDYSWGSVRGVTNDFAKLHGLNLIHVSNCWKLVKP
jgi:predicted O-methyltransferase YrrM